MFTYLLSFPACVHGFLARTSRNQDLIVQIWGRGLQVTFFKESQNLSFNIPSYHNEMFEIPLKQLVSYERIAVDMKKENL